MFLNWSSMPLWGGFNRSRYVPGPFRGLVWVKALETSIIPDFLSGLFLFFWDPFVFLVLRQPFVLAVLSSARCIILLFSNICEIPGEIVVVQCCLLLFQSITALREPLSNSQNVASMHDCVISIRVWRAVVCGIRNCVGFTKRVHSGVFGLYKRPALLAGIAHHHLYY
jgi:hypothetical protein